MPFVAKFFLFILLFAVLSVVGAWIMGGESSKHSTSITVDASPRSVFRYLTDGEKIKQWGSDIVSVGTFSEDEDGSFAQDRVVRTEKGEVVWEDSLMRFDAGNAISIQSRKGGLTRTYVYQLERNEIGGTNVSYRVTRSAGGLARLIFPFQEDRSDTEMAAEMTRLKTLIESEVEPADMLTSDESVEEESSVGTSPDDGDNEPMPSTELETKPVAMGDDALVDLVPMPTVPEEQRKPALSERKFESLFGTGRPK